ncbi:hypothetical protein C0Q58_14450 [Streptomyces albidoflavus]|uniref:helix-turn-helix domain-containing protein n=1 Tax=Streptomyces albidoflavus TaxID=1886 RepID=UPI00101E699E|nr:helix-turn-helix domain-containing protein [Streptomyces albidoflavus]RZD62937.1 hypothetical protein C0Q58_14450 [Streptomyces albidoflavus]
MYDIRVTPSADGQTALIFAPAHAELATDLQHIGARRDSVRGTWTVSAWDESRAREILRSRFGTDGSPEDLSDLVTVRIPLAQYEAPSYDGACARFAGRDIASRYSRDTPVKLGAGVVLVEGTLPPRGGSAKYPAVNAGSDVIVEIRNIPRCVLDVVTGHYEIVSEGAARQPTTTAELRSRRAELLAQVKELTGQLSALDPEGEARLIEAEQAGLVAQLRVQVYEELERSRTATVRADLRDAMEQEDRRRDEENRRRDDEDRRRDEEDRAPLVCRCGTHTCPPNAPTVSEYAESIGRREQTVRNMIKDGRIKAVQHRGRWHVTDAS